MASVIILIADQLYGNDTINQIAEGLHAVQNSDVAIRENDT